MKWFNKVLTIRNNRNKIFTLLLWKIGIWCIFALFIIHYSPESSSAVSTAENFTQLVTIEHNNSNKSHLSNKTSDLSLSKCDLKHGKVILRKVSYPQDIECRNFTKCLYENNSFKQTPLVSFPGSGNTWTRHLIELASGIFTGSIYTDVDLLARGFFGEKEPGDAGSTIVQKMHIHFSKDLNVSKAILLLRDPYKAIVSFVQYLESGHLGLATVLTFRKKEWPVYVLRKTYEWISIAKSWIEAPVELLILHYENLQGPNIEGELEKVCNFLQISCRNLKSKCFQNHKEGLFHRKRKAFTQPTFPIWVQRKVNGGINYLNTLLIQHGHSPLPLHQYQYQA